MDNSKISANLSIWNQLAKPPQNALKKITGGRLVGKTDINPQWRYKIMTDVFGMCGVGWRYTIDRQWTEQGADGVVMAFVNISLYILDYGVGKWSEAISANGGSKMVDKEKTGFYNNDEAYKMATTDALGTAMKMLGVASEVYEGNWDGSKWTSKDTRNQAVDFLYGPERVKPKLEDGKMKKVLEAISKKLITIDKLEFLYDLSEEQREQINSVVIVK